MIKIKQTATRIDAANYCRMRYYLKYLDPDKPKPLRLSSYAKGSLLHDLIGHFWEKLGAPEEVAKKSSPKKYFDAESFVKYAQGRWKRIIVGDENVSPENKIHWKYKNEKWIINSMLPKICIPLFSHIMGEGPPLFSELPFDFVLNNRRFSGKIDEVRNRNGVVVIRDYKSGKPWMGKMKLEHDPQLTFYNIGLCSRCCSDKKIEERLGLEDKIVKQFMGNPIYIYPDFDLEFFMIEALAINPNYPKIKIVPELILPTKRKNEHFFELTKMIDGTEQAANSGDIYPERGRKCDDCDMQISCAKKLDEVGSGTLVDKKGQMYFSFMSPAFIRKDNKNIKEERKKQTRMRFRWKEK